MKIACLVENLATFGGTQKQFLRIAENIFLQGHEVELYTSKFNKDCSLGIEKTVKVNIIEVPESDQHQYTEEFLRRSKNQLLTFDWLLVADGRLTNIKYHVPEARVCWICNDAPYSHKSYIYGHGLKFRLMHLLRSTIYKLSSHAGIQRLDKIIVLDSKMQKAVRSLYKKHAEIIWSGIDLPDSETDERASSAVLEKYAVRKKEYVFALSIAFPSRNFEVLIESARYLQAPLKILIVSPNQYDNIYFQKISSLAARHENIVLNPAFISEEEKYHLLRNAAVFVFPNKDQTWGLAPLEAASVKTPIIVSTGCGVTEALEDNQTALIFHPDDHQGLAERINSLHKDARLRSRLVENAFALIKSKLTWSNYTANIINYLKA
jgi:glycosyltransferase involved in cell wall biosynthesis